MFAVSCIVTMYNAHAYLEQCVRSLLEQTMESVEYIFVDDCSTDHSLEELRLVAADYPGREIVIKQLDTNRGVAAARNMGLSMARGKYIIFADSDDWVDPDELRDLYEKAERDNLEIVYCDYFENNGSEQKVIKQPECHTGLECIYSMLNREMHGSAWNKLVRKELITCSGQKYIDGENLYEDVGLNVRLFALAKRIGYLPKAYYHYRQDNAGSIIHSMWPRMLKRALERCANVEVACHFLQERGLLRGKLLKAANEWKLLAKNDLIGSNDFSLKRWMVTFPEADEAIWRCRKLTVNYKLLLTWLHLKWIGMYRLHRKIIGLL